MRARTRLLGVCTAVAVVALGCTELAPPSQQPVVLTTRARGEGAIAVTDDWVFWIDRGTMVPDPTQRAGKLWRVSKTPAAPRQLASDLPWPRALAADSDNLYWASFTDGRILKLDQRGGGVVTLAQGESGPRWVAVDGTDVYFVDGSQIRRVSKSGGAVATVAQARPRPSRLAVDGSNVYWLDGGTPGTHDGSVMKCPKSGGSAVALASGLGEPGGIALDEDAVYWTDRAQGLIERIEKDGGSPRVLAREQWNAQELAVDREHLYWQVGERIFKMRKGGGKPREWARSVTTVGSLALDGRNVYWLDNDGVVRSIAK